MENRIEPLNIENYLNWSGEDEPRPAEVDRNANELFSRVEKLLAMFDPDRDWQMKSGYRSPEYNGGVSGAAVNSKHMTGQAVDVYDPDGELDEWLAGRPEVLDNCALWLEHPGSTKGWCHLQSVPPKSGRRIFYP